MQPLTICRAIQMDVSMCHVHNALHSSFTLTPPWALATQGLATPSRCYKNASGGPQRDVRRFVQVPSYQAAHPDRPAPRGRGRPPRRQGIRPSGAVLSQNGQAPPQPNHNDHCHLSSEHTHLTRNQSPHYQPVQKHTP